MTERWADHTTRSNHIDRGHQCGARDAFLCTSSRVQLGEFRVAPGRAVEDAAQFGGAAVDPGDDLRQCGDAGREGILPHAEPRAIVERDLRVVADHHDVEDQLEQRGLVPDARVHGLHRTSRFAGPIDRLRHVRQ
ncbi:hypothetical protein [Nocardia sp. NPDC005825]|uniref:hypothetical protein n=1 Tax=unclassified Nocardia TaxID=2637762 RepID=UPI0034014205